MKFNNHTPLYTQLADEMRKKILMGTWKEDEKIPSVRDLALEYGINPNTAQKAIKILEDEGLVYAKRTLGKFVAKTKEETNHGLEELREDILKESVSKLKGLKTKKEEAVSLLERLWDK